MDDKMRDLMAEFRTASDKLAAKNRDIVRTLRKLGPTPVVNGKELPGTIVFVGGTGETDGTA